MYRFRIASNNIGFNIKKTKSEISFQDETGSTITWDRNPYNEYLVECMVEEITEETIEL